MDWCGCCSRSTQVHTLSSSDGTVGAGAPDYRSWSSDSASDSGSTALVTNLSSLSDATGLGSASDLPHRIRADSPRPALRRTPGVADFRVDWVQSVLGTNTEESKRLIRLWDRAREQKGVEERSSGWDGASERMGDVSFRVLHLHQRGGGDSLAMLVRSGEEVEREGSWKTVRLGLALSELGLYAVKTRRRGASTGVKAAMVEQGYDLQQMAQRVSQGVAKVRLRGADYLVEEWGDYSLDTERAQTRFLGNEEEVWRVARWLGETLNELHQRDILHLDIKPGNILYSDLRRKFILTDFDLAECLEAPRVTGDPGMLTLRGTIGYMAPELMASSEPTPACDTFGVGAVLYELLTGEAWRSGSLADMTRVATERGAFSEEGWPAEYRRAAGLAAGSELTELHGALLRLLHPDPEKRMALSELAISGPGAYSDYSSCP